MRPEFGLVYLPLSLAVVKKRARPFVGGSVVAFAWTYPLQDDLRYILSLLGLVLFLLGWPFERQPVKFWERFVNAVIGGTALAIAVGAYQTGEDFALLGIPVLLLILKNRVLASAGLLPASALYLIGSYAVPENLKLALWVITLVYSLHHLRKLAR
ncbi:hypothetical membrane protein [Thermococcus kodakarensis KOD1]|uniref:Hypothetical membrane protein n=1 Tax=Thermococcus kodakarensis (strain ATCC BAA-918 / JCM 12380 / KOD1) TaxID=69014 RepID=Q5JGC1_THEKO|nr:hypothetical protein [Thermococcus kodakarensis]WCN27851.1 hypothetical protein POG15_10035 [Thermococcus kodakarensis]WCN30149.1 hypothetical protein POG21_10020 [Thermococcus kodakarensis]BAD86158.1 hypothetical membrane protein [Thermococcus kodakarensis KOD1]